MKGLTATKVEESFPNKKPLKTRSQHTREDCVRGLREAAAVLGSAPDVASYLNGPFAPCYSTVLKHFGSWKAALKAAQVGEPARVRGTAANVRRVERTRVQREKLCRRAFAVMEIHMTESLYPSRLAQLTGTTPARLRRAFGQAYSTSALSELTRLRVKRAAALLETQELSVKEVATRIGYSYSGLIRVFTHAMNESPSRYQRRLRMEHAGRLLVEKPGLTVKEVAAITSPHRGHDFNKVFRRFFGVAPLGYRKTVLAERAKVLASKRTDRLIPA